ncbi:MAG TPA: metal-dependent hydrolase [Candidatus Angelobacter sp.]
MASLFTHALVAASLGGTAQADWRNRARFWLLAIFCSALPDFDVIGFDFGVRYGDLWGHRGMTHSLIFAAVVAILAAGTLGVRAGSGWKAALLFFLITVSHGFLDAMTDGGLGVAFFSPFDTSRYFFPWRPLHVSPIGAGGFFTARGWHVLQSEIVWVWLPTLAITAVFWGWRMWRSSRPPGVRDQSPA